MKDIKAYLKKLDYVPIVKKVEDNHLVFTIPSARLGGREEEYEISYRCEDDYLTISIEDITNKIELPIYARMPIIFIDIINWCLVAEINPSCVVYLDGDKEVDDLSWLIRSQDAELDLEFLSLIAAARKAEYSNEYKEMASKMGVLDGYLICQHFDEGRLNVQ